MKKKSVNFNQKIYNEWNSKELKNFEFQLNEVVTRLNEAEKQQKLLLENSNIENYNKINEGIWDSIKYGLSKLGSLEKGGKIFGRGKQSAAAEAQLNALLDQQSNILLKNLDSTLKKDFPGFPDMKDKEKFAQAVLVIGTVYDSIVAATKLPETDKKRLDPKAANAIIDTLHKYVDKTASYDLSAIYRRFAEEKENSKKETSMSMMSILAEAGYTDNAGPLRGAGKGLAAYDTAKSNKAVVGWLAGGLAAYGLSSYADAVAKAMTISPVPIPPTPTPGPKNYTIKSGDTLSDLAAKNKVSVKDLMNANPSITNPQQIFTGNELIVPPETGNAVYQSGVGLGGPTGAPGAPPQISPMTAQGPPIAIPPGADVAGTTPTTIPSTATPTGADVAGTTPASTPPATPTGADVAGTAPTATPPAATATPTGADVAGTPTGTEATPPPEIEMTSKERGRFMMSDAPGSNFNPLTDNS